MLQVTNNINQSLTLVGDAAITGRLPRITQSPQLRNAKRHVGWHRGRGRLRDKIKGSALMVPGLRTATPISWLAALSTCEALGTQATNYPRTTTPKLEHKGALKAHTLRFGWVAPWLRPTPPESACGGSTQWIPSVAHDTMPRIIYRAGLPRRVASRVIESELTLSNFNKVDARYDAISLCLHLHATDEEMPPKFFALMSTLDCVMVSPTARCFTWKYTRLRLVPSLLLWRAVRPRANKSSPNPRRHCR